MEHPLVQCDAGKILDVSCKAHLLIAAAIDIFEKEVRHPAARGGTEIGDIGNNGHLIGTLRGLWHERHASSAIAPRTSI